MVQQCYLPLHGCGANVCMRNGIAIGLRYEQLLWGITASYTNEMLACLFWQVSQDVPLQCMCTILYSKPACSGRSRSSAQMCPSAQRISGAAAASHEPTLSLLPTTFKVSP